MEPGGTNIAEERPPNRAEGEIEGESDLIDKGKAELCVGEEGPVAAECKVVVSPQGVGSPEEVDIGSLPEAVSPEKAEGEQGAAGQVDVVSQIDDDVGKSHQPLPYIGAVGDGEVVSSARKGTKELEQGSIPYKGEPQRDELPADKSAL